MCTSQWHGWDMGYTVLFVCLLHICMCWCAGVLVHTISLLLKTGVRDPLEKQYIYYVRVLFDCYAVGYIYWTMTIYLMDDSSVYEQRFAVRFHNTFLYKSLLFVLRFGAQYIFPPRPSTCSQFLLLSSSIHSSVLLCLSVCYHNRLQTKSNRQYFGNILPLFHIALDYVLFIYLFSSLTTTLVCFYH